MLTRLPASPLVPAPGAGKDEGCELAARHERAVSLKQPFLSLMEECYAYCMPGKQSLYAQNPGTRKTNLIYDETAVVGAQEFASRIQAGVIPPFSRWSDLRAGPDIPIEQHADVDRALDPVTEYVFEVINASNFAQEASEAFLDVAVGTGFMHVDKGDDALHPIRCTALPVAQTFIDVGPDDQIDFYSRERKMRIDMLARRYPGCKMPSEVKSKLKDGDKDEDSLDLIECCEREWEQPDEVWNFCVLVKGSNEVLYKQSYSGLGSNPFIGFRWSKIAGETWGRGPLMNAMPAIKTCNLTVQLILENAEMAMGGMFTAEDDGVVNVDTIQLLPGTIIPIAPGSAGLKAIGGAGKFDVAQLILQDMRANIKRALYNDMLGNPDKTPMSATEVSTRMADLSRQIGSAFGRLQTEFVEPFIRRVVYLLKQQGRIKLPAVNGREVKIVPTSPLSQAQAHQDVTTAAGFIQSVGQMFGPQAVNVVIDTEKATEWMSNKLHIPRDILRDAAGKKQLMAMLGQAMQQQSPNPEASPPNGSPQQLTSAPARA